MLGLGYEGQNKGWQLMSAVIEKLKPVQQGEKQCSRSNGLGEHSCNLHGYLQGKVSSVEN